MAEYSPPTPIAVMNRKIRNVGENVLITVAIEYITRVWTSKESSAQPIPRRAGCDRASAATRRDQAGSPAPSRLSLPGDVTARDHGHRADPAVRPVHSTTPEALEFEHSLVSVHDRGARSPLPSVPSPHMFTRSR